MLHKFTLALTGSAATRCRHCLQHGRRQGGGNVHQQAGLDASFDEGALAGLAYGTSPALEHALTQRLHADPHSIPCFNPVHSAFLPGVLDRPYR